MFDWNEDEVDDIIWGESSERGDHIVPYPKGSEEKSLFSFGNQIKKQTNEETDTTVKSLDQGMHGIKSNIPGSKTENGFHYAMNDDLSGPPLEIDPWPDWLSLDGALEKMYPDRDSAATEMVDGFTEEDGNFISVIDDMVTEYGSVDGSYGDKVPSSLKELSTFSASDTSQLNSDSEPFAEKHAADEARDSFLDCDWANIGDLDDLDRILRNNDSMLEHDMIGSADELVSCMPSVAATGEDPSEEGYPPLVSQVDESSGGKSEPIQEDKNVGIPVKAGRQSPSGFKPTKADRRKMKGRRKADDKRTEKSSEFPGGAWSHSNIQTQQFGTPRLHFQASYPAPVFSQQRQIGGPESMRYMQNPNPYIFMGYGYPAHHYPIMPVLPQIQSRADQIQLHVASENSLSDSSNIVNTSQNVPNVASRPLTMTPREKIEKLRRRQKMQAMLAIQQQQQKFSHKSTCSDQSLSQNSSQKNLTSDATVSDVEAEENDKKISFLVKNSSREHDDPQDTSMSVDGVSLEEKLFHQLQDVLAKLDVRVRICIRDSLFRLAKSAKERNSTSDSNTSNRSSGDEDDVPANNDVNVQDRISRLPDAETVTNPIDRTVAHLLFHKPLEPCGKPAKDVVESPDLSNPVTKQSCESVSKEKPEEIADMEVDPQL
ncbi:hypothetical protein QJS10_CPB17g01824 [Acorus calamus]|uniref:Protein LNK2 n=1 Tax=Acorus calamus TaxID=4465 RepID=A0AAV9CUN5_ACOCL|nr:hypothetical protein QJS10_CPB17g01824 [Acorus calamus]